MAARSHRSKRSVAQLRYPQRSMAGRPRYRPTPADRDTVKAMAAAGIHQSQIAKCIGEYGVAEKTLRLHFRKELDLSKDQVTAVAMSKMVAAMNAGEAWAICFWMKCRAGWQERQILEHTTPEGARPVQIEVVYTDKSIPE